MLQNRNIKLLLTLVFFTTIRLSAQSGTFRNNANLFGPFLGFGGSLGHRADYDPQIITKKPGTTSQFGMSWQHFLKSDLAYTVSASYVQTNWFFNALKSQSTVQMNYKLNERNILLPVQLDYYINPYRQRCFISFGIVPGFLTSKSLAVRYQDVSDSSAAAIYNERPDFKKLSMGGFLKFGVESDINFTNTIRFCVEYSSRLSASVSGNRSAVSGLYLTAQYLFAK